MLCVQRFCQFFANQIVCRVDQTLGMPLDIAHYYNAFVEYETNFKGQVQKMVACQKQTDLIRAALLGPSTSYL